MEVLWWLVPPAAATGLAMVWAAWLGRTRDEVRRDDSDAALDRMQKALARPTPTKGTPVASARIERTHGVAVRGSARPPGSRAGDETPSYPRTRG